MDVILKILLQLGANETMFIQFGIFVVTISVLTVFVFGPFFKAYDQRLQQTKGADQVANETQNEAKKLEAIYKTKAREINEKIKNVFDESKNAGVAKINDIVGAGKATIGTSTEAARVKIKAQKSNAEKEIAQISQDVANEISKKLTGSVE
jgi:F0F1-type ATP synthase membrane subunit b/b'